MIVLVVLWRNPSPSTIIWIFMVTPYFDLPFSLVWFTWMTNWLIDHCCGHTMLCILLERVVCALHMQVYFLLGKTWSTQKQSGTGLEWWNANGGCQIKLQYLLVYKSKLCISQSPFSRSKIESFIISCKEVTFWLIEIPKKSICYS